MPTLMRKERRPEKSESQREPPTGTEHVGGDIRIDWESGFGNKELHGLSVVLYKSVNAVGI